MAYPYWPPHPANEPGSSPYARSEALLKSRLSKSQLEFYYRHGYLEVTGSKTGRTYRVPRHGAPAVRTDGGQWKTMCFHPPWALNLPPADNMLANAMLIRCNEKKVLRIANPVAPFPFLRPLGFLFLLMVLTVLAQVLIHVFS